MYRDTMVQSCIETCMDCQIECERCSTACLLDANPAEMAHCIQLTRDCANICGLVVRFLAHNSDFMQGVCELGAEISVACRDECARHDMEFCRRCANACHRAAEMCERLTLQPVL
jgi:hypothetical protein